VVSERPLRGPFVHPDPMLRACLTPRCPRYAVEGKSLCAACLADRWDRGQTGARGSRGDWKRRRAQVLARDHGACRDCGAPATTVHHVDGDATRNDPAGLLSLCGACHRERHRSKPPHNAAGVLGGLPPTA
jgi:5-methylcytosine-specific restriction endonuclease McrA